MRKQLFIPVLLALMITGLCLTNLTGCAGRDKNEPAPDIEQAEPTPTPDSGMEPAKPVEPAIPDPAVPADGPLTEDELWYFNTMFFNSDYLLDGERMNIRNQFLSSSYDRPERIDLYELFYCGTGLDETMTDEEWAAFEAAGGFVEVDVTKISASGADAVLTKYMGLTLEETDKVCLNYFIYLPEYDAYYHAHGDTNYRGSVTISAGERKDGLIYLYYDDEFYADGWKRVALRETEDGGYQFVSNGYCNEPDLPGR